MENRYYKNQSLEIKYSERDLTQEQRIKSELEKRAWDSEIIEGFSFNGTL